MSSAAAERAFRREYAAHRASEGRALAPEDLLALPYLSAGPLARQWSVRARSFDAFVSRVLTPVAHAAGRPLRVLDLGAGNGWLCWHLGRMGHSAVALDVRDDDIDGLGAASTYLTQGEGAFARIAASFEALPLAGGSFDIVVFNAALHYALDLEVALAEAARVTATGGRVVILDTPFYGSEDDGLAMVAEKKRTASAQFGERAQALLALPFIEFLTASRLRQASESIGLAWLRHRVRYPAWYELRPALARLRGGRVPSRFDVWEAVIA